MDDNHAAELRQALDEAGLNSRPVAVLDLDAVSENLTSLRSRAQSKPIRVASKSLRVRQLLSHVLDQPGFNGILAFTLPEALWLHSQGHRDIVVAYPTADVDALQQLRDGEEARGNITVMIDDAAQLKLIPRGPGQVRIAVELDASWRPNRRLTIGALRSPVRDPDGLAALARHVVARSDLKLVGLMAYEGQIAGVADAGGSAYRRAVRAMKTASAKELAPRRARAVELLSQLTALEFVNGGGTGSLETSCQEPALTEVAAGSGIVAPGLFDHFHSFTPRPALHVGFDVVRRPAAGCATVLGGGWVASGTPGPDRLPTIAWPRGLRYASNEGAGEVQTPLLGRAADALAVGDIVWFRHAKAGELAEHVNHYVVVRRVENTLQVIDTWPTYRGEGKAFL